MKTKSMPWAVVWFLLSIIGFFSHLVAVVMGSSFEEVALLSFIYFTPLLAEAIDDFSKIRASDGVQHAIDKWATLLGVIYLAILTMLVILKSGGILLLEYIPETMRETVVTMLKGVVVITPGVFVLKKLYDLRMS